MAKRARSLALHASYHMHVPSSSSEQRQSERGTPRWLALTLRVHLAGLSLSLARARALSLSHTHKHTRTHTQPVAGVGHARAEMNTHSTTLLRTLSATSGALPDAPRAIWTPPAPRSRHSPTHPMHMSNSRQGPTQAQTRSTGHVRRRCRSAARLRARTDPNLSPFSPATVAACVCV